MEGLGGGGRMGTGDVNSLLADEGERCRSRPAGSLWDEKKRVSTGDVVGVVITTLNKV